MHKTLADLAIGKQARVINFTDATIAEKLLEMGCLPGEIVSLEYRAPLGDPIAISLSGYLLSMRKAEAATVTIEMI